MMFKSVEPLDSRRHGDLACRPAPGFAFARQVTTAPLAASEMVQAAREFPVVFSGEGKLLPVAVFSARRGENPFVAEDGSWTADYVPAHIRRYPFILGETRDSGRFLVMIDRAAPHFAAGGAADGERLFDAGGGAPEDGIVARAKAFLGAFQRELAGTEAMLRPLDEHGVLARRKFVVTSGARKQIAIDGFRIVDRSRMNALDDGVLAEWLRTGLMDIIHSHLHSLGNAQRLLRRQADRERVRESA